MGPPCPENRGYVDFPCDSPWNMVFGSSLPLYKFSCLLSSKNALNMWTVIREITLVAYSNGFSN